MVPDSAVPDLLLRTSAHAGLTPGLGQCRDGSLSPDSLEIPKSYLRPLSLLLTTARSFSSISMGRQPSTFSASYSQTITARRNLRDEPLLSHAVEEGKGLICGHSAMQ